MLIILSFSQHQHHHRHQQQRCRNKEKDFCEFETRKRKNNCFTQKIETKTSCRESRSNNLIKFQLEEEKEKNNKHFFS